MSGTVVLILRILLIVCLYGFLGWTLITIWRDLKAQGMAISSPFIPAISLIRTGPDEEITQTFQTAEVIVGRSTNCDFSIVEDTVSARHARLSYHHNQWWVEDMRSTNGTFLNDERVNVPTVVVSGDDLRCGQVNLVILVDEKSAAAV